eukprot:gene18772-20663_t
MEVDSDYEFNAPKYIDFLSQDPENEHLDKWFDENPDGHEGGIDICEGFLDDHHSNYQEATKAISAALQITKEELENGMQQARPEDNEAKVEEKNNEHDDEKMDDMHEEDIVQACNDENVEPCKTEENTVEEISAETVESKEEKDEDHEEEIKKDDEIIAEKPVNRVTRSNSLKEVNKAVISAKKRKSVTPLRQTPNRKSTIAHEDEIVAAKKPKMDAKKPMMTMPNTPSFLRRIKNKLTSNKKTSEAMEIERIKQLQKETKKRLKENESSLQKALAPQPIHHSQKQISSLTKTQEFHFATDQRIKQHPMKTRSEDETDSHKFVNQLRKHPPSPTFKNKKPTKPAPFKFSSGSMPSASSSSATNGNWKSIASAVIEYQTKTPDRWKSRPANQQNSGPHLLDVKAKNQLTHPKTPQLVTKSRARPSHVQSQSDVEAKIANEIKSYKFKAKEFDRRIYEMNGESGLPDLARLPLTETKPFRFESDNRLEMRKKNTKDEDLNEKSKTQHEKQSDVTDANVSHASRKRSLPRKTEPKPFSFETRDKAMLQKKQEKIQKILEDEEKAREFHARPLPDLSPDHVIVKPNRIVEAKPFNLATDERGAVRVQKWKCELKKELEGEKEKVKFKAQPCKVVHQEAFVPKPSSKPLVEINGFKLNTEERSKKREEYYTSVSECRKNRENEMQQNIKETQEVEEEEIKKLRKQMVHVANPVRKLGEIVIKPSEKPVTLPETPKFETNKRFGSRVSRL